MKRNIILFAVAGIVAGALFLVFRAKQSDQPTLKLYTWSAYFPEDLLAEFTKQTGAAVEVSYFSNNEELFAKFVAGASGYDLILPSDYMVQRMAARGMLLPIDRTKFLNFKHLDPEYLKSPYDPGLQYSVPYARGYTGIVINTDKVKIPESGVGWDMIFQSPDPTRTSLLDDMREVFAAGLMYGGHSVNEISPGVLETVSKKLQQAKKSVSVFSAEPVALLLKGEITIAHAYTSHAAQVEKESKAFRFFFPKEGAVVWTDNLAIPKGARYPELAHRFIDFFLDPDRAAQCARGFGLATPNRSAFDRLTPAERGNSALYPDASVRSRVHFLEDLMGESLLRMDRLWTEMKTM